MNVLDIVIIIALLAGLAGGYRRGFWLSLARYAGALGGLVLGVRLAPDIIERSGVVDPLGQQLVTLLILFAAIGLGGSIGFWIAGPLRGWLLGRRLLGTLDSLLGATLSALVTLVVVWLLALTFARGPVPELARAIQRSAIVRQLDEAAPIPPTFLARLQQILSGTLIPPIWIGLEPRLPTPANPSAESAATAGVRAAAASTVRVQGQGCGGIATGSGFAVGDGLFVTNAHVVTGTSGTRVSAPGGGSAQATTVLFDPGLDLAILRAPGLTLPALAPGDPDVGEGGAVIGYPGGGPQRISPAVIGREFEIRGRDIYSRGLVTREILTVAATVRPGNSGGPVVDEAGRYVGVIFGASVGSEGQAYALSLDEVLPAIERAAANPTTVNTRTLPCAR